MTATKQLREEHEGIKLMLGILEKVTSMADSGQKLELDHIGRMLEFFKVFVDKCHHGKEEEFLFPELEKRGIPKEGGPIGVMLSEHSHGRKYIQGMTDALVGLQRDAPEAARSFTENARAYISLLQQHILKENDVLFGMGDKVLSPQENETLLAAFEKLEIERIGVGKHEEFHKLLHTLRDIYLKQS